MTESPETYLCQHEFDWAPDGLDGMCKHCNLYVMKPNCVSETAKWFRENGLEDLLEPQ
jgi:hypothetical protein